MKKMFLAAGAAMLLLASACNQSAEQQADDAKFQAPAELNDTISSYYGYMIGSYVLSDFQNFKPENQTGQTKQDIIKGLRIGLSQGTSDGTIMGLQIACKVLGDIDAYEQQFGVKIDRQRFLRDFIKALESDSLDMDTMRDVNVQLNRIFDNLQQQAEEFQAAQEAKAPAAVQNERAGQAFLDKLCQSDPEVKTTESGLRYKITTPATEQVEITDQTKVTLHYTGRLIDGTVFDSSVERNEPATFAPSQVIPGFGEGLKLLGPGAKATLYIPGNIAYGPKGAPQAGIGPNQLLIFDLEIISVAQ